MKFDLKADNAWQVPADHVPGSILHLENFRHLTGFGRAALSSLEHAIMKSVEQGNHPRDNVIALEKDPDTGAWIGMVGKPTEEHSEKGELEIILPQNGGVEHILRMRLGYLHKDHKSLKGTHSVYAHKLFFDDDMSPDNGFIYVGITKQGWQKRLSSHINDARNGSPTLFHKALRSNPRTIVSNIMRVAADEDTAMSEEERLVAENSLCTTYARGLNMIPGGRAGLKQLYACRIGGPINIDNREKILGELIRKKRISTPNPAVAAHWNDPSYAEAVICGRDRNFNRAQLERVMGLQAVGHSPAAIAGSLGVKEDRIKKLIEGKTYTRIKLS